MPRHLSVVVAVVAAAAAVVALVPPSVVQERPAVPVAAVVGLVLPFVAVLEHLEGLVAELVQLPWVAAAVLLLLPLKETILFKKDGKK